MTLDQAFEKATRGLDAHIQEIRDRNQHKMIECGLDADRFAEFMDGEREHTAAWRADLLTKIRARLVADLAT